MLESPVIAVEGQITGTLSVRRHVLAAICTFLRGFTTFWVPIIWRVYTHAPFFGKGRDRKEYESDQKNSENPESPEFHEPLF